MLKQKKDGLHRDARLNLRFLMKLNVTALALKTFDLLYATDCGYQTLR